MNPEIAGYEQRRLEALRCYHLLDTSAEQVYDDIVRAAAAVCDVPIALVSLIDADRQWFKARVGLDVQETPRSIAFCDHVIRDPEHTMIVEDATLDARFAENPLVTGDPSIRFYLGAPLQDADGMALGTLCVIDRQPRRLTAAQVEAVEALRRVTMQLIAQRKVSIQLAETLERVKTLSGLLPICAHCLAIRDDEGYWDNVAHYFSTHTDYSFSHGICPSCLETHYPEVIAEREREQAARDAAARATPCDLAGRLDS